MSVHIKYILTISLEAYGYLRVKNVASEYILTKKFRNLQLLKTLTPVGFQLI